MNIFLMVVMMGVSMVFFHGQGHHKPSPESKQHEARPEGASAPSSDATHLSHQREEPSPDKAQDPAGNRKADPLPPTPRAE